jgi:hypothetical protein
MTVAERHSNAQQESGAKGHCKPPEHWSPIRLVII